VRRTTTRSKCQVMKFAEDRRGDANQIISRSGANGGVRGHGLSAPIRRVGVNAIDQMMQLGRTIILLEPDALFAGAAAAGKFS
jgi:hypothetical protein